MFGFLSGYKTYLASFVGCLAIVLFLMGLIPYEVMTAICALVGFVIPAFLRDAIRTETQKAADQIKASGKL
jgi:hypothetical protein